MKGVLIMLLVVASICVHDLSPSFLDARWLAWHFLMLLTCPQILQHDQYKSGYHS